MRAESWEILLNDKSNVMPERKLSITMHQGNETMTDASVKLLGNEIVASLAPNNRLLI